MAHQKIVYTASDGKEFPTEAEADVHEATLEMSKDVEAYIESAKLAKPQAGLMRKHLPAYFAFIARNQAQPLHAEA